MAATSQVQFAATWNFSALAKYALERISNSKATSYDEYKGINPIPVIQEITMRTKLIAHIVCITACGDVATFLSTTEKSINFLLKDQ